MSGTHFPSYGDDHNDSGHARNSLLESLNKYQKQLGYSASELQMIISDLASLKPVDIVPDPSPRLLDIISESALNAFDKFNTLNTNSTEALNTGKDIEAMKKRFAQLLEEELQHEKTATSAGAALDEKLELCKTLVNDSELRYEALSNAREELKSGLDSLPRWKNGAISNLESYESELNEQSDSLQTKQSSVVTALTEHEEFLRANQLEIDALEARLKALREEREKRIAEAEEANNEEKKVYLEDALKMNKLASTAVNAETTLINTSMGALTKQWESRTKEVTKALATTSKERVKHFKSLCDTLTVWISKKEQKLDLMRKLVENAAQAEREGLQVTFDVDRTKKDIEELKQALDEHRILQEQANSRLKELQQQDPPAWLKEFETVNAPAASQTAPKDQKPTPTPVQQQAPIPAPALAPLPQYQPQQSPYAQNPSAQFSPYSPNPEYSAPNPYGQPAGLGSSYNPSPMTQIYQPPAQQPYQAPYQQPFQGLFNQSPYQPQAPVSPSPYGQPGVSVPMSVSSSQPPRNVTFDDQASRYHTPKETSSPQESETFRKIKELGYDDATARRAAAYKLPMKDTIEKLLSGVLFDAPPPSTPAPVSTSTSTSTSSGYPSLGSSSATSQSSSTPRSSAPTSSSPAVSSEDKSNFGGDLQMQDKGIIKTAWKPYYFLLNANTSEVVYGTAFNPELVKVLNVLTEDDLKIEGRFTLGGAWSCFEKQDPDSFLFEINNPKSGEKSYLLKAATREERNEWIRRIRVQISRLPGATASSGSSSSTYPSVSTTTSSTSNSSSAPKKKSGSPNDKELIAALEKMGFSKAHAEKAVDGAADMNEALERVMTIQALDGNDSASRPTPSSASSAPKSRVEPPTNPPAQQTQTPRQSAPPKGMAKCGHCGTGFSYPVGAQRVECHSCHTINNIAPPSQPSMIALQCGLCKQRVDVPRNQESFVCPECSIVNKVKN